MKHTVIIGAGPAGLTAAYLLLTQNERPCRVTVVEADGVVGGISRTVCHHGNRMDIGGHRFFSKDPWVNDFWAQLMPLQGAPALDDALLGREKPLTAGGPDPQTEDRVMLIRDRVSRIYYDHKFFDYPISMKPQTFRNMGLGRTIKAGCSYMGSMISKKPEDSLENFYINRFGRVLYNMFFEGYTEKLWGRHPREIAADWGAQRVKGLSIKALLKDMWQKATGTKGKNGVETSLIEQFYYPKFGPGQLWEQLAEEVRRLGGDIRLNCPVTGITVANGKVTAVTCGETVLEADEVISSMPVKDLIGALQGERPDGEILRIADGLPYRDFVTVGLLMPRLNLKNETSMATLGNIVPDCWIYVQDSGVKLGRIQIFNNWSPYMTADPQNTVWVGLEYFCAEGDEFWNLSEESCVERAVEELCRMGVLAENKILDAHRERVKKAYPAYFDTYGEMDRVVDYLNGIDGLYCIGRNGQHRYNNMDHSMLTAKVCVDHITGKQPRKEAIWQVNTEKSYHEEVTKEN